MRRTIIAFASAGRVAISRGPRVMKAPIEVTDTAAERIKGLMTGHPEALGIRIGVKTRGCNGQSYTMQYATEKKKTDEQVVSKGVTLFVEPQALLKIIGTTMDWHEDELTAEFVFANPNAKSVCGCGESFNV